MFGYRGSLFVDIGDHVLYIGGDVFDIGRPF